MSREKIFTEFSMNNAYRHMHYLVDELGEKMSGSAELSKAAAYISSQLRSMGIEAESFDYYLYHSDPGASWLSVGCGEQRDVSFVSMPLCHSMETPDGGIEGELVYVDQSNYDDYERMDPRGKIVVTDMSWSPGRPEKARIAWEKGAKALIIINLGTLDDKDVIQTGGVKSQWGNPTPFTIGEIPAIPVIGISKNSGTRLKRMMEGESGLKATIVSKPVKGWVRACQVMAYVRATCPTDEYVLVGGHMDAWGRTAICNSSGNAMCLELARVFFNNRDALRRNIVFGFWDGHEIAECAGSTWYLENNWSDVKNNCVAYVDIDNLAIRGTTLGGMESVLELKPKLMEIVSSVWPGAVKWSDAYKTAGDASFFGAGLPYIHFASEYTKEEIVRYNNAFYGPWVHSDEDLVDKVDVKLYEKHAEIFVDIICYLAESSIIDYDTANLVRAFRDSLCLLEEMFADLGAGQYIGRLGGLRELTDSILARVETITACKADYGSGYTGIMKRIMYEISPILRTFHGRYGNDPCCSELVKKPLPLLYQALNELRQNAPDSVPHILWETEYQKRVNRTRDGLEDLDEYLRLILK